MLNLAGCSYEGTHARSRRWPPIMAMMAIVLVGCGDSSGPPTPGALVVKTQTSGFLKAASYQLVVAGTSEGMIGATDEVTLSAVDPGSYSVELAGVPDNCSAQGATVAVASKTTTEVSLAVTCAYTAPVSYTLAFRDHRMNLDTGELTTCPFGVCPTQEGWDMWVYNDLNTQPRSNIRQNVGKGVEIAHVAGVTLQGLTEAHYQAAVFSNQLVADPFDAGRVILIRTDLGNVFALGNPVETSSNLTFSAALIATP
jgi:hypothetical protein